MYDVLRISCRIVCVPRSSASISVHNWGWVRLKKAIKPKFTLIATSRNVGWQRVSSAIAEAAETADVAELEQEEWPDAVSDLEEEWPNWPESGKTAFPVQLLAKGVLGRWLETTCVRG